MAGIESLDDDNFLDRTEPLDVFQQEFNCRTADIKELGTSVYRQCWDEFYCWEPGGCQELITTLPPNSPDSADFEELISVLSSDSASREQGLTMDVDLPTPEIIIIVTMYGRDGSFCQAPVPFDEVVVVAAFAPHPTYESCPPTSKNIARRFEDQHEDDETLFIPYADEKEFDAMRYAAECRSFSWQVDWKDPDRETS